MTGRSGMQNVKNVYRRAVKVEKQARLHASKSQQAQAMLHLLAVMKQIKLYLFLYLYLYLYLLLFLIYRGGLHRLSQGALRIG